MKYKTASMLSLRKEENNSSILIKNICMEHPA